MKKILAIFVVFIILIVNNATTFASDKGITIRINGGVVLLPKGEPEPYIENGRTMVPIRFVAEELNTSVSWNDKTKQVYINKNNEYVIVITIGNSVATIGTKEINLDANAVIKNGRTFVPLRFVSEAIGAEVDWDSYLRTVHIFMELDWLKEEELRGDEAKEISDLVKTLIELETRDNFKPIYKYLDPPTKADLKEEGVTEENFTKSDHFWVTGGFEFYINMFKLDKYYVGCRVYRVSDSKLRAIYGMFINNTKNELCRIQTARTFIKIGGQWFMEYGEAEMPPTYDLKYGDCLEFNGEEKLIQLNKL